MGHDKSMEENAAFSLSTRKRSSVVNMYLMDRQAKIYSGPLARQDAPPVIEFEYIPKILLFGGPLGARP